MYVEGVNNHHWMTMLRDNSHHRDVLIRYDLMQYLSEDIVSDDVKEHATADLERMSYGHQSLSGMLLRMLFKPAVQV